jgi:hypothetical protein
LEEISETGEPRRDEVTVAEMIGIAGLEVAWRDRTEA